MTIKHQLQVASLFLNYAKPERHILIEIHKQKLFCDIIFIRV